LHPRRPLPRPAVLRLRVGQPARMLGALWLLQPHLDTRRPHQLVAHYHTQLGLRGGRFRPLSRLLAAQPLPGAQRHRPPDEQDSAHRRCRPAPG
ncbi:hypothetical protein BN1708_020389, partial [Verticillium longisporum]